jgi:proteasome lid subunit RPN8/RPN11
MEDKILNKSFVVVKHFLTNHSNRNLSNEICGFIGYDEKTKCYVATIEKNQAQDPKSFFSINPASYLKFKSEYSLIAVFHSHVVGDESPSEFDIKMSESCCLSFIIYSINTNKFHIYEPKNQDYDVKTLERIKGKLK